MRGGVNMSVLSKIPTTNVTLDDVSDTLNSKGGSTTYSLESVCSANAKVHWPARYKPTAYPKDHPADSDKAWQAYIEGDTYNSGRCGVDFPTYTSTSSLSGVTDAKALWKHKPPTGSDTQKFRLLDFAGYNPSAKSIIASAVRNPSAGGVIIIGANANSNIAVTFNNNLNTDALDYTEIGYRTSYGQWLNKFYFGIVVISSNGSYHGIHTMDYTMEGLNGVTSGDYAATTDHYVFQMLNTSIFKAAGTYKVYPCLFLSKQSVKSANGAISVSDGFIPLPCTPLTVETTNAATLFTLTNLSATAPSSGGNFTVKFRFTNKYDFPLTISPNMVGKFVVKAFPYTGNISDYPNKTYKEETIQTAYTCPANSSIDISYQTSINVSKGQLIDLQVQFYYNSNLAQQVSNSFINPF